MTNSRPKKCLAMLLSLVMTVGLLPMSVFADTTTPVTPSVSWEIKDGIVSPIAKNTIPTGSVLKYTTEESGTTVSKWNTDADYVAGQSFSFAFAPSGEETSTVEEGAMVRNIQYSTTMPIQNQEVTKIVNDMKAFTTSNTYNEYDWEQIISSVRSNREAINAVVNTNQQNYLSTIISPYESAIKIYEEAVAANKDINTSNLNSKYNTLASLRTRANNISVAHFKTYITNYLNNFEAILDAYKLNNGVSTDLENELRNSFPSMYSRGVTYNVAQYVVNEAQRTVKVVFETSAGISSLKYGDYQTWMQYEIMEFMNRRVSGWNNGTSTGIISMPKTNGTDEVTLQYAASALNNYSKDKMDDLTDDISSDFDYLSFEHTLVYVNGKIEVIANGLFSRTDSDWTKRNENDFIDWYTYEIAEPIVRDTGKDVKITFYDRSENLLTTREVPASSLGGSTGSGVYSQIQKMLNNEFDEWNDLKFEYTVNGTSKTINVVMKGTNFREKQDMWQSIDRTSFDNWVEKQMVLSIATYQDSNVRIELRDRNGDKIDSYIVDYEDVAASIDDVEDHLNDNFYSWGGIYWDFSMKKSDSANNLYIKGDFRTSDSVWKDLDKAELSTWVKSVALYVMENIPRDLNVYVQSETGGSVKTYNYKRAGFNESYDFENSLNAKNLTYEGFSFDATVSYSSDQVTVGLYGTNFSYNDSSWKNVKDSKAFLAWIEDNVVVDAINEFGKSVRVVVYDDGDRQQLSKTYSKSFNGSSSTSTTDLQSFLNKNMNVLTLASSKTAKFTYTVSYSTSTQVVTIKAKTTTASSSSDWTSKDSFEYNRFIELILDRAAFTKKSVKLEVVDSSNKTIDTFTGEANRTGYTAVSNNRYAPNSGYIQLNSKLYEKSSGNWSLNAQTINYLKDISSSGKYKIVLPFSGKTGTMTLKVDSSAASALRSAGYSVIISTDRADFELSSAAFSGDNTITIKADNKVATVVGGIIPITYDVNMTRNVVMTIRSYVTGAIGVYKRDGASWTSIANSISGSSVVGVANMTVSFNDISSSPYSASITKLATYGIVNGVGNNMFSPKSPVTRAQAAQMIVNGFAPDASASGYFSDVPATMWCYDAVMKASTLGIVNGIGNNLFSPNTTVSQDQWLVMLKRAGDSMGLSSYGSSVDMTGVNCGNWAKDTVSYMISNGVVSKTGYNGSEGLTREKAAELMCKYLVAIGYIQ